MSRLFSLLLFLLLLLVAFVFIDTTYSWCTGGALANVEVVKSLSTLEPEVLFRPDQEVCEGLLRPRFHHRFTDFGYVLSD